MEHKLAEGMPSIELLYNEAKQIHFFAFHKSHIPDKMNEETEQKLSLVSAICGLAPVRGDNTQAGTGRCGSGEGFPCERVLFLLLLSLTAA